MKVLTIELEHGGTSLIERMDTDKASAVDCILEYLRTELLENLSENIDELTDGESFKYTVLVQRKRNEKYMSELNDFDGF